MVDIDQIFLLKRKESEGTNNVLAVTKLTTLTQMMPDYNYWIYLYYIHLSFIKFLSFG